MNRASSTVGRDSGRNSQQQQEQGSALKGVVDPRRKRSSSLTGGAHRPIFTPRPEGPNDQIVRQVSDPVTCSSSSSSIATASKHVSRSKKSKILQNSYPKVVEPPPKPMKYRRYVPIPIGVAVMVILIYPLATLLLLAALGIAFLLYKSDEPTIQRTPQAEPPKDIISPITLPQPQQQPPPQPQQSKIEETPSVPPLAINESSPSTPRSRRATPSHSRSPSPSPSGTPSGSPKPSARSTTTNTTPEEPVVPVVKLAPLAAVSQAKTSSSLSSSSPSPSSPRRRTAITASSPPTSPMYSSSSEVEKKSEEKPSKLKKKRSKLNQYGYCKSFLPLLLRNNNEPAIMDFTPKDPSSTSGDHTPSPILGSVTKDTRERVLATCNYFLQHYAQLFEYVISRKQRQELINNYVKEAGLTAEEEQIYRTSKLVKENLYLRLRRTRCQLQDFQVLAMLGRGGYGEVYLCRDRHTGQVVALKRMKKSLFINKNEVPRVKREKEVMTKLKNPWMVKLLSSFQDEKYLYLCMEYLPGGDLKGLLSNVGCLSENHTRIYVAEIILAVEALHQLGYIHRDLKPGNFLIDKDGHLKLIDFGLSKEGARKSINKSRRLLRQSSMRFSRLSTPRNTAWAYSLVGSPEYMAPEIIAEKGYDETSDWWSVGILMYEMLYGFTPFIGDSVEEIFQNIASWATVLQFPDLSEIDAEPISDVAVDLMKRLVCEPDRRLGKHGAAEIKQHLFFSGFDWEHVRSLIPPFVPKLQSEVDTTYFGIQEGDSQDITDLVEMELKGRGVEKDPLSHRRRSTHFAGADDQLFAGFTYTPLNDLNGSWLQHSSLATPRMLSTSKGKLLKEQEDYFRNISATPRDLNFDQIPSSDENSLSPVPVRPSGAGEKAKRSLFSDKEDN